MENEKGILRSAAAMVWSRQRVLWWLYVLNLGIMLVAAYPVSRALEPLDYSLLSDRLVHGMDLGVLTAVLQKADVGFAFGTASRATLPQVVYFVAVLFLTGGILSVYAANRRFTSGEFFQGCGACFWRLVRLFVFFAIVMIAVFILYSLWSSLATSLASGTSEKTSFWLYMSGFGVLLVLFVIVRLWLDMAQVRAVVEDQRATRRTLGPALRQTFGNGRLFAYFLVPLVTGWIVTAAGFWLWQRIPSHRFGVTFVMWQVVILLWVGMRLWQRAGETIWYQRHRVIEPAPVAVAAPAAVETPAPAADSAAQ